MWEAGALLSVLDIITALVNTNEYCNVFILVHLRFARMHV